MPRGVGDQRGLGVERVLAAALRPGVAEAGAAHDLAEQQLLLHDVAVADQRVDGLEVVLGDLADRRVGGGDDPHRLDDRRRARPSPAALDRDAEGEDAGPPERLELGDRDAPLAVALDRAGGDLRREARAAASASAGVAEPRRDGAQGHKWPLELGRTRRRWARSSRGQLLGKVRLAGAARRPAEAGAGRSAARAARAPAARRPASACRDGAGAAARRRRRRTRPPCRRSSPAPGRRCGG